MIFRQLFDRDSCTYTYLLADPVSREAVLIDTVFEHHARDVALLRELDLRLTHTLDTHAHADHVTGAWLMKQSVGSRAVLSARYGAQCVDVPVDHGDTLTIGDHTLEIRATPGHTSGCLTFVLADQGMAFTGDCLLIRGAGRTDFQQGSAHTMFQSITQQIFTLPGSCLLYPGHDYSGRTVTTVAEERQHNARVGGDANEEDFVGYMENLGLPHPRKLAIAVPANLKCGQPDDGLAWQPAAWGPVILTYAGIPQIEPEWVLEHLDDVHLLDVRSEREIEHGEEGPLTGAQIIPLDQLRARVSEVAADKPVIAVCRSGRRSAQATVILRKQGVADTANLAGGMLRLREMGAPIAG